MAQQVQDEGKQELSSAAREALFACYQLLLRRARSEYDCSQVPKVAAAEAQPGQAVPAG
jgi:hypothetical protein